MRKKFTKFASGLNFIMALIKLPQCVYIHILFTMRATGNIFRKKIVFYENALNFLALLIINRKYHDIKIQPHLLIQAELKSKKELASVISCKVFMYQTYKQTISLLKFSNCNFIQSQPFYQFYEIYTLDNSDFNVETFGNRLGDTRYTKYNSFISGHLRSWVLLSLNQERLISPPSCPIPLML